MDAAPPVHGSRVQRTRLAPSPTGALHLGNARTFIINWALARQRGWKILLRIEDLDGPRTKPGGDRMAMEDLAWLGIDWDEGPVYQSPRAAVYHQAVESLLQNGQAYPCVCSRREVELAAGAPHAEDGADIYPGTCRGRFASIESARRSTGREPAVRFIAPDREIHWTDGFAGDIRINPARQLGDFVIRKADGTAAYQLAVVVDDAAQGVTHVVRGDDLIDSTPRQITLHHALGLTSSIPSYIHLPLVLGPDDRRLAKRHGDTRLRAFRDDGRQASDVMRWLAQWSGIDRPQRIRTAREFADAFQLETCPRSTVKYEGKSVGGRRLADDN